MGTKGRKWLQNGSSPTTKAQRVPPPLLRIIQLPPLSFRQFRIFNLILSKCQERIVKCARKYSLKGKTGGKYSQKCDVGQRRGSQRILEIEVVDCLADFSTPASHRRGDAAAAATCLPAIQPTHNFEARGGGLSLGGGWQLEIACQELSRQRAGRGVIQFQKQI